MRLKDIMINHMVKNLTELCQQELELENIPDIKLIYNQSTIGSPAFGQFDGSIRVVAHNRHPMDVMRTLAHELVHWKQQSVGQCLDGSDGSDTENQANAIAGTIMRKFGKMYPECFDLD